VPGTPFSLLLSRSLDFQLYYALLELNLTGSRAARLVISTFQSAWDTVEASVWLASPIEGHARRSLQQQQLSADAAVHTTATTIGSAASSGSERLYKHVRQQQQQRQQQHAKQKQQQWFSWRSSSVLRGAGATVLRLLLPVPQQQQAARALLHDMLARYSSVPHSYSSRSGLSSGNSAATSKVADAQQQHRRSLHASAHSSSVRYAAAAPQSRSAIAAAAATTAAGSSTYRMPVLIQAGLGDAEVSTVGAEASQLPCVYYKFVYCSSSHAYKLLTSTCAACAVWSRSMRDAQQLLRTIV
jgi:membrane protein YqaA with SNARE-associated domain